MKIKTSYFPSIDEIKHAENHIREHIEKTNLSFNHALSNDYQAKIHLKREDFQIVRSYKIRGAFYMISKLLEDVKQGGVICSSAGNHAQGVALACSRLKIHAKIYMPEITPKQKIQQVRMFGGNYVTIILIGDTYDDAHNAAIQAMSDSGSVFIPPFDHPLIIAGQGTIGLEIMEQLKTAPDYIFIPVGGGGLAAGVGAYIKHMSPNTKIIGVEPQGAASMSLALKHGRPMQLDHIDRFIDGAAVKKVGNYTFEICQNVLDDLITVPEGLVSSTMLKLYNQNAMIVEPAGALSVAALELFKSKVKGKNVVCIISGGNNDITRTEEIKERALLYEGLKHYFIIRFPQRSGALKYFLNSVLGSKDDITLFEYSKKNNREKGPALVGVELQNKEDINALFNRLKNSNFTYEYLNSKPDLFQYIVL